MMRRGEYLPRFSDIPDPDTGPVDVIETVTTTATRPFDWPKLAAFAIFAVVSYELIMGKKKRRG